MPKRARINDRIRVKQVRAIDQEGKQLGVMPLADAIRSAKEASLDLVEVAPQADPPVCRIMDYGKYKYEQEKRSREARKKQKAFELKEQKFRPHIDEHDYQIKLKRLREFLGRGNKVKVTIMFRGREMAHLDLGRHILDKLSADLADVATMQERPKVERRDMTVLFAPK